MDRFSKTVFLACALLTAVRISATFFPDQRLWGLNLLHYVPPLGRWIITGIAVLALAPKVNRKLADLLTSVFNRVDHHLRSLGKNLKYILVSLLSFPLFWWFAEEMYLLGDGNLRASEIASGMKASFTEPLDFFLHSRVFSMTGMDVFSVYALLSCLAGVVFVYLTLILSDKMGGKGDEKFLAFSVLITMGANQLFFGYVESYTLMYVAVVAFILFSWLYLQGRCGFPLPALMFLFAASLHLAGLTLLPSLAYLAVTKRPGDQTQKSGILRRRGPRLAFFLLCLLGAGLWILWRSHVPSAGLDSALLFPLGSLEKSLYPVYSPSHLVDFLNHQLLVSPVGVAIWFALVLFGPRRLDVKSNLTIFFVLLIAPQLLFAFLFNPQLGYPRDWDLFAFTSSGYTILGIYLILRLLRLQTREVIRYVTLALAATALLSTVPWIGINASQKQAIARFEQILKLDPQRAALGHECLAYNYRRLGRTDEQVQQWNQAILLSKKPRYVKNLGAVYVEMGEYAKAAEKLEEAVILDPGDHVAYSDLGKVYLMLRQAEKAESSFERAVHLQPDNPEYYGNLGLFLLNSGKSDQSVGVFKKALQLRPDLVSNYRNLGFAYANSGNYAEAVRYLRSYLDYAPGAEDRIEIEAMIERLNQRTKER